MVAVVDYDFHFQELNDLLLIGSLELPARGVAERGALARG
jgi:hypothetical protein